MQILLPFDLNFLGYYQVEKYCEFISHLHIFCELLVQVTCLNFQKPFSFLKMSPYFHYEQLIYGTLYANINQFIKYLLGIPDFKTCEGQKKIYNTLRYPQGQWVAIDLSDNLTQFMVEYMTKNEMPIIDSKCTTQEILVIGKWGVP